VIATGEIDGTTYMMEGGARRAIADVELELVDSQGKVALSGRSASDGYFIIANVPPGQYQLRPAGAQLQRLRLTVQRTQGVTIGPDGTILNGRDLYLERAAPTSAPPL
jgi:hypothetical protein